MQLSRVQFPLWRMMAVIASIACLISALVVFSDIRNFGENVLVAWAALYSVPLILMVTRGVAVGRAAKIGGMIFLCGLPMMGLIAFFNVPAGVLAALLLGWLALIAVALFYGSMGKLFDKMRAPAKISVAEPELPPLLYDSEWVQSVKTSAEGRRDGHWIGFLFLLPFVVMFVLHEPLGMTDAFLMGDQVSASYNLMTFAALFFGSWAFVIYAVALPIVKGRGSRWVAPKIVFLVCFWAAFFLAMNFLNLLHP